MKSEKNETKLNIGSAKIIPEKFIQNPFVFASYEGFYHLLKEFEKFKNEKELMQKRIEELEKQNEIMKEALISWLKWEELQIKKDGEYVGQDINNLINMGREALKQIEEK
jgi:hypothetical protein